MHSQVAECGTARIFSLAPEPDLVVQVHMPTPGQINSGGQSLVEFLKAGPLSKGDLAAVAAAMRAANHIEGADAGLQVPP